MSFTLVKLISKLEEKDEVMFGNGITKINKDGIIKNLYRPDFFNGKNDLSKAAQASCHCPP